MYTLIHFLYEIIHIFRIYTIVDIAVCMAPAHSQVFQYIIWDRQRSIFATKTRFSKVLSCSAHSLGFHMICSECQVKRFFSYSEFLPKTRTHILFVYTRNIYMLIHYIFSSMFDFSRFTCVRCIRIRKWKTRFASGWVGGRQGG